MADGLTAFWRPGYQLNGKLVLGGLLCYLGGVLTGVMLILGSEDFHQCDQDLNAEFLGPWYLRPLQAWRRKQAALEELSENPWTVVSDPEFAAQSYYRRAEHIKVVAGFAGSLATAIIARKVAS